MVSRQWDNSRVYTQCFGNVLEGIVQGLCGLLEELSREWLPRWTDKGKKDFIEIVTKLERCRATKKSFMAG
jgi:hypothetical protein